MSYIGQADVLSLEFSPDGKILAAGYNDTAMILWEVNSRQVLTPAIYLQTGPIFDVSFSRDGAKLASASDSVQLWDTSPASWIKRACARAGRNLTLAEWNEYFPNRRYEVTCANFEPGNKD